MLMRLLYSYCTYYVYYYDDYRCVVQRAVCNLLVGGSLCTYCRYCVYVCVHVDW